MHIKKKIIVMAVGAALGFAAQSSFAAITVAGAATSQNVFAKELANDEVTLTNAAGNLNASAPVTSFGPTSGQPLYITVSLDQGAKFVSNPTVTCSGYAVSTTGADLGSGGVAATWQLGGAGAATASYVLTDANVTASLAILNTGSETIAGACTVGGTNFTNVTGNISPITMTVGYAYGSLATSTQTGTLLTFAKTVSASVTPASNVAEVSSGFMAFTAASSGTTTAHLGTINLSSVYAGATGYAGDGTTVVIPGAVIGSATITLTGPALAAAATTGGVYLVSAGQACVTSATDILYAATAGNTVTFTAVTGGNSAGFEVCMTVNGTSSVPADTITASLSATGKAGAVALLRNPDVNLTSSTLSTVTHNGTTLIAPLVNVPAGWISRLVLVNRGSNAAAYTVTATGESGNTITLTGEASSGSVAAGTTNVIDLTSLITATGSPRTSLQVVIDGAAANVDGQYQLVNAATGNLSNYVLKEK